MRRHIGFLMIAGLAWSQAPTAPVVSPRGLVNAHTQQPAPSTVARGGLLHINGFNLGPPEGLIPSTLPLPTKIGNPELEVLINGIAAPILSAWPERVVVQVPVDAALGIAEITVRKGEQRSRLARCFIQAIEPGLRTAGDTGFGLAATSTPAQTVTLTASGLGPTEPRIETGSAAAADDPAKPAAPVTAYVGGIKAAASASASRKTPGEFEIQIEIPQAAGPGDLIHVSIPQQNQIRAANSAVFQQLASPEVLHLPLPEGVRELRAILPPDLNGTFLIANGPRAADGCFPAYAFHLVRKTVSKAADCLAAANANVLTPATAPVETNVIGALVGPPPADAQPGSGISSKVQIFNPALDAPIVVDLPAPASNLAGVQGMLAAQIPGTPPQLIPIDPQTGELRDPVAVGGAAGGGPGGANLPALLSIDVDGLKQVLSAAVNVGPNRIAVIVGDDASAPTRAKFAIVALPSAEIVASKDFPEGWLPLLAPPAPNRPGAGGGQAPAAPQVARLAAFFDPPTRTLHALARNGDNSRHGLALFPLDTAPSRIVAFPEGRFAAVCTPQVRLLSLDLARRLVLFSGTDPAPEIKDPCPAFGFLQLDFGTQAVSYTPVQGEGQFNAAAASSGDLNDFVYGANTAAAPQARADTIYVLDGVSDGAFRLDLPAGITAFQNLQPAAQISSLIGVGTNRAAGDAGFIIFDLDRAQTRVLNVPEGFVSMNQVGLFLTTRKLVARGLKADNAGSQFLIFDLLTTDLQIVPNPAGVAWVGAPPQAAQPGQPPGQQAQMPLANPKANTVAAFTYDADRRQNGVVVVRIP